MRVWSMSGDGLVGLCLSCPVLSCAVLCCADHGEDKYILTDYTLLPTILKIAPQLPRLQGIIVLTDRCVS